jgi:transglutaminase-like putative cysteine protease
MSRLRIVHRSVFSYAVPATASYNEVRMLPFNSGEQFVLSAKLDIHPAAAQHGYIDYWGTQVSTFEVLTPHTELSVTATSLVEVRPALRQVPDVSWDELRALSASSTKFVEFSSQSRLSEPPEDLVRVAHDIADAHPTPHAAAMAIAAMVHEQIKYTKGVTGVQTTATHAWEAKNGVCQDIAHVTLGALRAVGIPARYVSGYLQSRPNAQVGETIVGESHAWVEWFVGDWYSYDPTNMLEIGERHVTIARGRDYKDVSPLRGVYAGAGTSGHSVKVEITVEA